MEYVFKTDEPEIARQVMKAGDMSLANYRIYYHWRNLAKHGDGEKTYDALEVLDSLLEFWNAEGVDPVED